MGASSFCRRVAAAWLVFDVQCRVAYAARTGWAQVFIILYRFPAEPSSTKALGAGRPCSRSPDKGEGAGSVMYSVCRRGDAQCHLP